MSRLDILNLGGYQQDESLEDDRVIVRWHREKGRQSSLVFSLLDTVGGSMADVVIGKLGFSDRILTMSANARNLIVDEIKIYYSEALVNG